MPEQTETTELAPTIVKKRDLEIAPEMVKEYGIRAVVREQVTEYFEDKKLVRRVTERQRVEFTPQK